MSGVPSMMSKCFFGYALVAMLVLVFATTEAAEPPPEALVKVGFYWDVWGYPRSVRLDGKFAYISIGESDAAFQIVDISDPANPKHAGQLPYGWAYHIDAKDDVAFCVDRGSSNVDVWDTRDKAHPKKLAALKTPAAASPRMMGDYLVIYSGPNCILYDIRNAREPKALATIEGAQIACIEGTLGWCSDGRRVDLGDPAKPKIVGKPLGKFLGIVKDYVYIGGEGGTSIYRKNDLEKPAGRLTGEKELKFRFDQVTGDWACFVVSSGADDNPSEEKDLPDLGLWIVDVSAPVHPRLAGRWGAEWAQEQGISIKFADVRVRGTVAYVLDNLFGLRMFDISDPKNIRLLGEYKCGGEMCHVKVSESAKRAYVGEYLTGGVTILSLEDPRSPKKIGYVHMGDPAYNSFAVYKDSYLYFDRWADKFSVADIRTPAAPRVVYQHQQKWGVGVLIVHGDYLVARTGLYGLKEDPVHPRKMGDLPGVDSVVGRDNYIYSVMHRKARQDNNFQVFDISDPAAPKVVARLTIAGDDSMMERPMQLVGDRLYVGATGKEAGITVIDVSAPSAPKIVGEYRGLGSCGEAHYSFHIAGDRLYAFQYFNGRENGHVFDIREGLDKAKAIQNVPGFYSWHSARLGNFFYVVRLNGLDAYEITPWDGGP